VVIQDCISLPVGAIGRGPKTLLSTGLPEQRTITSAPEMRDGLRQRGINVEDAPLARDGNLLTARDTEQLPAFVGAMVHMLAE